METPGFPEPAPAAGPQIKGQLFLARLEYLRDGHGPAAIEQVLASLPGGAGEKLRGIDRESWYPFSVLVLLDTAIAKLMAPGQEDIIERLGGASARHRTEWLGEHVRLFSVHGFLSRVADEHRRFHSFGHAAYRRTGFTQGEIAFSGYPEAYEVFCRSSRGFFRAAVSHLAGAPATVEERTCQCRGEPACVFHIRWRRAEGEGGPI
jgi:hypothetical protein